MRVNIFHDVGSYTMQCFGGDFGILSRNIFFKIDWPQDGSMTQKTMQMTKITSSCINTKVCALISSDRKKKIAKK